MYNSYSLTNDFDQPESAIYNFSEHNILHVIVFNLFRDEVIDDKIYEEMNSDRKSKKTVNLDNYLEIFYASRY